MRHPAKYSDPLIEAFAQLLKPEHVVVVDMFAGTGKIHELFDPPKRWTYGVEIEPEWANMHERTYVGDFFSDDVQQWLHAMNVDAFVTSPTYGNRMADHHEAKDDSRRNTYRHALGRPLTENNSGGMQWGDEYRRFHGRAWRKVWELLRPGGRFVLNVKDHVRGGVVQEVSEWHRNCVIRRGFVPYADIQVPLRGNGFGANGDVRVPYENVFVFDKPLSS